MVELPEVEQMQQVRRPAAVSEQLRIAGAPCHLCRELVSPQAAKRSVERNPRSGEAILSQEGGNRQRVLCLRHRVQMPAIELAELLAVFTEVESDMSRQAGPIGVPFLHTNVSAFEADEDFRMRVGIEGRLEADFELSRIEILALHPAPR